MHAFELKARSHTLRAWITHMCSCPSCCLHTQLDAVPPPDIYAGNHLINHHAKSGRLDIAHQAFDQMPHRNLVSWTILISGYAQQRKTDTCFCLFSQMLHHFRPNDFAYSSLLSVCDYSRGIQLHALAFKTSFHVWTYVANALIAMYSKNGIEEVWNVYQDASYSCNIVTYNSMINGLGMYGHVDRAMTLFNGMCRDGIQYDHTTILTLISSLCGCNTEVDEDVLLTSCLQLHCASLKTGLAGDVGVVTVLIKAYSKLGGHESDIYKLFLDEKSVYRDVVLWTTVMGAFLERKPGRVLSLFNHMRMEGFYPDSYVFSVLLKACASLITEKHTSAVYSQVIKVGFVDVSAIRNALVHAYGRCGSIDKANQVFEETANKDIVSWNSMLKAYALHGKAEMVLSLYERLDVTPDGTTFVALLLACSHAGLVEEGMMIYNMMQERYGIVPQLDHYACIVDILGRAGRLTEAVRMIGKMPMEPDYVVWSALLGACRKHGDVHLADLASSKLKELDPDRSLGYVMLSNVHCSGDKFDEGGIIWKSMRRSGVRKAPGLSWTEVDNTVHEFSSGGKRHPEINTICAKLEELLRELKRIGYVPETSLVLYDIEEEQKEEQLYVHSEKLALVYSLMKGGAYEGVVNIIKNIRICLDCHNFMRLASKFVGKDIVVRDANRFHHFKDGDCSCDDYW